jgi:hypothetical protein
MSLYDRVLEEAEAEQTKLADVLSSTVGKRFIGGFDAERDLDIERHNVAASFSVPHATVLVGAERGRGGKGKSFWVEIRRPAYVTEQGLRQILKALG